MPSINYLVTTLKKSDEEIAQIIELSNIKGTIIVGNQGMSTDEIKRLNEIKGGDLGSNLHL